MMQWSEEREDNCIDSNLPLRQTHELSEEDLQARSSPLRHRKVCPSLPSTRPEHLPRSLHYRPYHLKQMDRELIYRLQQGTSSTYHWQYFHSGLCY